MQRICALSGEQLAVSWLRGGGGGGGECSGQLQLPEVGGEGKLGELGNGLEGVRENGVRENGAREKGAREKGARENGAREKGAREQDKDPQVATLLASDAKLDTCNLQVQLLTHVYTHLFQL